MSFLSILIIAIGLGMDAFSVAIGVGAGFRVISAGAVLPAFLLFWTVPVYYACGGLVCRGVGSGYRLQGMDHWIAFGLLFLWAGK